MKRASHPELMRGLAAVVHHTLDRCRAESVPVDDAVVGALAVVDDWLARGAPDGDDPGFGAARDAAYKAGEAASREARHIGGSEHWQARAEERTALIRANWLATAVGIVCHTALRQKGWSDVEDVMNDCTYAAPSLTLAELEEIRARAVDVDVAVPPPPARAGATSRVRRSKSSPRCRS